MKELLSSPRAPEGQSGQPASLKGRGVAPERGLSAGMLVLFIAGSLVAHGGAYAALSGLPSHLAKLQAPQELAFLVLAPSEPVREPPQAAPALPPPPAPPVMRAKAARPAPTPAPEPVAAPEPVTPAPEPAPIQHLASSTDTGLAVAGSVGAAAPLAGTSLSGAEGGKGLAKATPSPAPAPAVDLRRLATEWMARVRQAISARAAHGYPRAAKRADVEGLVMLRVHIAADGRVQRVEVASSSGHRLLDDAAVAAAQGVGAVPAPPAALVPHLKPLPVPVSYTLE